MVRGRGGRGGSMSMFEVVEAEVGKPVGGEMVGGIVVGEGRTEDGKVGEFVTSVLLEVDCGGTGGALVVEEGAAKASGVA